MNDFDTWLEKAIVKAGGISAACIDLESATFQQAVQANKVSHEEWLAGGFGADMNYLERMVEEKSIPNETFNAKSAIVITFDNSWGIIQDDDHSFPEAQDPELTGYISAYARRQDYHRTGHQILTQLLSFLQEDFNTNISGEATVDTKPVFERFMAIHGGLGILGPNDLLRTPEKDVRAFIGTLFIQQKLPEVIRTPKMRFPCQYCQNCVENCPTGAITAGAPFDSRLCTSYVSIEKKGLLDKKNRQLLGHWLFGCDDCQNVCPPKDKFDKAIPVDLEWLLKSSAGEIKRCIKGMAPEYAGVTKLRRNAVAILQERDTDKAKGLLNWVKQNSGSAQILDQINIEDAQNRP